MSKDGTKVAFYSQSSDLVPDGNNGAYHVYVKNLVTGELRLVDRTSAGTPADTNGSGSATVNMGLDFSPDGNWLAFCSPASNLAAGAPVVASYSLYRVNLVTGALNWLAPGCRNPRFSPDGLKIAWTTAYNWLAFDQDSSDDDVYAGFLPPDTSTWLNPVAMVSSNSSGLGPDDTGPNSADNAAWSPDSTRIAFAASIKNLVPGDTNVADDIFVKTMGVDLNSDGIERISVSAAPAEANAGSDHPSWSPDGSSVAFDSAADNLVIGALHPWSDIFVKNVGTGAVSLVSVDAQGASNFLRARQPRWSPDGTRIAFSAANVDYNGFDYGSQIYVKNLVSGWRQAVSATASGVVGNSASTLWATGSVWSPDSNRVIFQSNATNFVADNNAWQQDVFEKTLG
jgi:Tol biopolymer transport system component